MARNKRRRHGTRAQCSGSQHSAHARLLENRLAYEVLEAVYHAIPAGTRRGPAFDETLGTSPDVIAYQYWVHARLRESGLAKALAAGPDFLPDIYSELPLFWRYVARLSTPRTYRRLVLQVLHNLAWYLGDGSQPVTVAHKLHRTCLQALLLTLLLLLPLLLASGLGAEDWPVIALNALLFFAVIELSVWGFGQEAGSRHRANCAELYAYLLHAYAEPELEGENRVESLLIELGRDTDNSDAAIRRRARAARESTGLPPLA